MYAIRAENVQAEAASAPTFRLLGHFTVDPSNLVPNGRKARALLARLAMADRPLSRDRLSALFWSRRPEPQAHASLRQCLMELKAWTRASPPLVRADRDTVAINRAHVADDLSLLVAACAADDAETALRWLPGEDVALLADLDGIDEAWDDWLAAERARQNAVIVRDVLAMADRLLEAGAFEQTLAVADRMTRFDPCSEHAARLVMRARWQAGDYDGVRHAWQRIEDAVARGLDGKPAPDIAALYKKLMTTRALPVSRTILPTVMTLPDKKKAADARSLDRPTFRRLAALVAGGVTLALVGADVPTGAPRAAALAVPVVRIEPVVARGNGVLERQFVDALAGDFARLAGASGGSVRVLDQTSDDRGDFIVRVAVDREDGSLVSESRVIDALGGSILWSSRQSAPAREVTLLRERTAVSVSEIVDCAQWMNSRNPALAADPDRRALLFAVCDACVRGESARAIGLLEQMRRRWPRDVSALAWMAFQQMMYADESVDPVERSQLMQDAIRDARQALALDPDNALAMVALSQAGEGELQVIEGLPMVDRALAIEPGLRPALWSRMLGLFQAGFVDASVDPAIRVAAASPVSGGAALLMVRRLAAAGRLEEASERFAEVERRWPAHPYIAEHRRRLAAEYGQEEAAAVYRAATPEERRGFDMLLLHQIADPASDHSALDAVAEEEFSHSPSTAYILAAHYSRTGDMAKALAWLDRAPVHDTGLQWSLLYWPSVATLRRDPRFFNKMARIGLVDYWLREDRWPDFCREPGLRYECRSEAARLARIGRAIKT